MKFEIILKIERSLSMVADGIKLVLTKGMKKVEKFMMRFCRANLTDIAEVHHMDRLIT
jgi:hypothetical protein